jgi:hypothetical protein
MEIVEQRASLGVVKDFNYQVSPSSSTTLKPNDIHYDILLEMFRNDPVLSSAIDICVEACTNNGFKLIGDNKKLLDYATRQFYEEYDFDRVVDNLIYSMLIYGDAFLELRREGDKVIELHPLETTEMEIKYDAHGEYEQFIQKPKGKASEKQWIKFAPEDIVHFRLKWIGSRVYSYNPLEPIANAYTTKVYAFNYLKLIFQHLPPKLIYILNSANEAQRIEFMANLRRCKSNPHEDLVIKVNKKEDFDFKEFQVKFDAGLNQVLEHLRNEVLMITRVPPDWLGGETQNRSVGEFKVYPFEIRMRKLQQIISSDINKKLLPALNMQNLEFKFNPMSFMDEKSILENANIMKGLGLEAGEEDEEHPIIYYLKQKGIQIPNNAKIPSAEEQMERQLSMQPETATGQSETAPSRMRSNKQSDKMTSNINRKGVSAEGGKKLEKSIQKSA